MEKKLYRSTDDKVLFGVCGGIAEYFGADAVLIRLLTVLLTLTGSGLVFYIIAAVIMKEDPRVRYERYERYEPPRSNAETYYSNTEYDRNSNFDKNSNFNQNQDFANTGDTDKREEPYMHADGHSEGSHSGNAHRKGNNGIFIFGLIFVALGIIALFGIIFPFLVGISAKLAGAVILIAIGLYFVLKR